MGIIEFAKKEQIKNFFEGLVQQAFRKYSLETVEAVEKRFYDMIKIADEMDSEEASTYLIHCLGLYMLESYATNDEAIIKIKPKD